VFENSRWGRWSTAVKWTDVRAADVTGDGQVDVLGRAAGGQWWISESTGRAFVNRRAADLLAALDGLIDDDLLAQITRDSRKSAANARRAPG
jgi:hypothetical protein